MSVVVDGAWLRRGYQAITFFGTIVAATEADAKLMRREDDSLHRHEMIHLRQAQSIHDSWLLFYIYYMWYYVRALPQNRRIKNAAYRINPFEMEAYLHDSDKHYLEQCADKGATEWRTYARMSPRERVELVRSIPGYI
jgi:hypothetical protein